MVLLVVLPQPAQAVITLPTSLFVLVEVGVEFIVGTCVSG